MPIRTSHHQVHLENRGPLQKLRSGVEFDARHGIYANLHSMMLQVVRGSLCHVGSMSADADDICCVRALQKWKRIVERSSGLTAAVPGNHRFGKGDRWKAADRNTENGPSAGDYHISQPKALGIKPFPVRGTEAKHSQIRILYLVDEIICRIISFEPPVTRQAERRKLFLEFSLDRLRHFSRRNFTRFSDEGGRVVCSNSCPEYFRKLQRETQSLAPGNRVVDTDEKIFGLHDKHPLMGSR